MTTVDIMRHGEPQGGKRYRGNGVDDPLSDEGWRQMRTAAAGCSDWTAIVSSPMLRCRAFAEELAGELGLQLRIDERLREVGFGSWEGRTSIEIRREDPEGFAAFQRDPAGWRPSGAERLEDFVDRVGAGIDTVLASERGGHTLVVAHAGVIRATVARLLQVPLPRLYRINVPYAGLTRLVELDGIPRLAFHAAERLPAS